MAGAQLQDDSPADTGTARDGVLQARACGGRLAARWRRRRAGMRLAAVLSRGGGDRLVYGGLRAVWALLAALPPERARAALETIGLWVGRVDRHHRRIVDANLQLAFGSIAAGERGRLTDASFRNWGRLVAEVVHAEAAIEAAPAESWRAAAAAARAAGGGGLLVLTAHTGNFEILARTWCVRIGPVAVFHRNLGNPLVDEFLRRQRRVVGMTTVGRGESVRDTLRLLADGTSLVVALDQNQRPGRGIFVEMFGRAACTSTILARLSLASGAAVLPVFAAWEGEAIVPLVGAPIRPPANVAAGAARAEAIATLTQRYTNEIEAVVRRYPQQWNWAHRRWKTRPDGEVPQR